MLLVNLSLFGRINRKSAFALWCIIHRMPHRQPPFSYKRLLNGPLKYQKYRTYSWSRTQAGKKQLNGSAFNDRALFHSCSLFHIPDTWIKFLREGSSVDLEFYLWQRERHGSKDIRLYELPLSLCRHCRNFFHSQNTYSDPRQRLNISNIGNHLSLASWLHSLLRVEI